MSNKKSNYRRWIGGTVVLLSFWILAGVAYGEDALRDGNRTPTLLFDQNGEPKRVSNSSPLPVAVTSGQFTFSSTGTINVAAPNPLPVTVPTPLAVSAAGPFPVITTQTFTVAASTTLPVSIQGQSGAVTVVVGNQVTPVPVSIIESITTTTREITGSVTQTLITPAAGKRLVVKGSAVILAKGGAVGTLRFQGGLLVNRVNKIEHSGNYIPANLAGAINEPLVVEQTGAGGGDTCFFSVNTVEQ